MPLPGKSGTLLLLRGEEAHLGTLTHYILAQHLLSAQDPTRTGIIVCADNVFYPSILVGAARRNGDSSHHLLRRLEISRSFTIHQWHTTVVSRLEKRIVQRGVSLVILSGVLPLFADRAVMETEARDLLSQGMSVIRAISRATPVSFLIPLDDAGFAQDKRARHILTTLESFSDKIVEVVRSRPDTKPQKASRRRPGTLFERSDL